MYCSRDGLVGMACRATGAACFSCRWSTGIAAFLGNYGIDSHLCGGLGPAVADELGL